MGDYKRSLCQFALSIVVCIALILICTLSLFLYLPLKAVVFLCARVFRPDLDHFVSGGSALYAQEKIYSQPQTTIYTIYFLDGHIDITALRNAFQTRVLEKVRGKISSKELMYPELRMYMTTFLNYNFWKQDLNFDLNNHIRIYDGKGESELSRNGEGFCFESDLKRVMGPLLEQPWKEERSPWEILLIQNYKYSTNDVHFDGKSSTLLYFRCHHSLMDGYSISKMIVRDLMLAEPQLISHSPKWTLLENLKFFATFPFRAPWDFAGLLLDSTNETHCWHNFGEKGKLTLKVVTGISEPIDFELLKMIRNKYRVSVTAVMCFVSIRCCQRLMEAAGQVVPKEMSIAVPIPFTKHPDGCVNVFTVQFLKCPMNSGHTKEEQLKLVSKRLNPSKFNTATLTYGFLFCVYSRVAPNSILKQNRILHALSFSIVPIAEKQIPFRGMGVKCIDFTAGGLPGIDRSGALFGLYSINGKQRFGVSVDKKLYPWQNLMDNFGDYVKEEVLALLEAS